MYVLFLFIHLIFAAVFYFFGRFPETVVFLVLGAVFFFAFWPFDFKKKRESPVVGASKIADEAKEHAVKFLKSGTYYLGFLFFYLSLYGIAYSLASSLGFTLESLYGWLTLALSVLAFAAFAFLWPKHEVASKIFRSNAFVFSAIHFFQLSYRLFDGGAIDALFITNVTLSLASVATVVFFGWYADSRQRSLGYLFLLAYAYVCTLALFIRVFEFDAVRSALAIVFLESVAVFDGLTRIRQLREFRSVGAYAWAVLSYFAVIGVFLYVLSRGTDAYALVLAFVVSAFQFYLHAKYENYLSLASVLALSSFLYFRAFHPDAVDGFFPFLVFSFGFPLATLGFAKWKTFHHFDRHFLFWAGILHAFSCFVGYFFRFSSYSVLEISLLSLWFSVLLFASFLGLRK